MSDPWEALAAGMPDERPQQDYSDWLASLAASQNEDELFERLGAQRPPTSKLARQQLRGRVVKVLAEKFRGFDSAASPAKTADAWLAEGAEPGEGGLQGREFVAEEVEPWGNPVSGTDVLDEAVALFNAYLFAPPEQLDALALWCAYTHAFDCFGVSPLLDISSPTRRCGKTTAVIVARYLVRKPLMSGNITPAALFRTVEAWQPTLLIDEADTFVKLSDELRGIVNAGHTRDSAFTVRAEGDANEPRLFSTWAPKLVAAIGRLPDTIEDRSIRIVLTRKPTTVAKADAFASETVHAACEPVRRRLARFALDNLDAIAQAELERPHDLHDRAWNNWRPLFAVAAAADPAWLERAREAARLLTNGEAVEEDTATLALLHVWETVRPDKRVKTADVLDALVAREDGPWAKWWEGSLAKGEVKGPSARLAKLLRPFGIGPKQLWIDGEKERGYDAGDFRADAVAPYLEIDGRDGKDGRSGSSTEAGSTEPTAPTEFSWEFREGWLLGEEMFPVLLANAVKGGHLTDAEAHERYALHLAVEAVVTEA